MMLFQTSQLVALATVLFTSSVSAFRPAEITTSIKGIPCAKFADSAISKTPIECIIRAFCFELVAEPKECTFDDPNDYYDAKKLDKMDPFCVKEAVCEKVDYLQWLDYYRLKNDTPDDKKDIPKLKENEKPKEGVIYVEYFSGDIRPLVDVQDGCSEYSSLWSTSHECFYHRICRGNPPPVPNFGVHFTPEFYNQSIQTRIFLNSDFYKAHKLLCEREVKPTLD